MYNIFYLIKDKRNEAILLYVHVGVIFLRDSDKS